MIKEFLEILPKKLILFLLVILTLIYLLTSLLNYLINFNQKRIDKINSRINELYKTYIDKMQEDVFRAVIQFIALDYLHSNKKYISKILINLPRYLPKSLDINSIDINFENNKIIINGSLPSWVEYASVIKYLSTQSNVFSDLKTEISFDSEKYVVILNMEFSINQNLTQ